ncbi:MAG: hypothetical protein KBG19_06740 [Bacteroidales bacterium]|nr:hypothetical protein [Bacteroidales bacterium]
MAKKTYVLLGHTEPSANVYLQVSQSQRIRMTKRKHDAPALQITFTGRDGKNQTIRLKLNCASIIQAEQIKEFGILANERFTNAERDAVRFKNGRLVTDNLTVQQFLEAHPSNEAFWKKDDKGRVGSCYEITGPLFKELDEVSEINSENKSLRNRINAAKNVIDMKTAEEVKEVIIMIEGAAYSVPPKSQGQEDSVYLKDLQNMVIERLDEMDNEGIESLNNYLEKKTKKSPEDEALLIVAKAKESGIISFDIDPKKIIRIGKGGVKIDIKSVQEDYTVEDKINYLVEFLLSDAGKTAYDDLKKAVEK